VVQVAGGRDHAIAAVIAGLMEATEVAGREPGEGVGSAEDRVAVRMRRPQGLGVELEHEIVRRVGDAVDLFEHDVPLRLEIALAEQRPADQVGENVHRER